MRLGVAILRAIAVWQLAWFFESLLKVANSGMQDKAELVQSLLLGLISGSLWIFAREIAGSCLRTPSAIAQGLRFGVVCYLAIYLAMVVHSMVAYLFPKTDRSTADYYLSIFGTSSEAMFIGHCSVVVMGLVLLVAARQIGALGERIETGREVRDEMDREG
jgi:hypothetical protein